MRVAFVAGSAQMGGTERNVLGLAGGLRACGVEVEVILLGESGPLIGAYRARRIPLSIVPWSYRTRNFRVEMARLAREIKGRDLDIIHAYGYPTIWWTTLAALKATRAARVIAIQAWDTWKGWAEVLLDRTQAPGVHLAIADGEGARQFAIRQQRLPPERTRTVYDGVDTEELLPQRSREETRAGLGIPWDGPAIGVVARLQDAHKGQSILLRAAPCILEHQPSATFVLVGEGPDRAPLEALAAEVGIAGRVRFAGTRTDLGDVLAALDLLVVPSLRFESVPKILVEGMAAGRPIVASRVGDIPELLQDPRTGCLVPPNDPGALAEAILACLGDAERVTAMGAAAREAVTRRGLHLDATTAKLHGLYEELLRGRPHPSPPVGIRVRMWAAAWNYMLGQSMRSRGRTVRGEGGGR